MEYGLVVLWLALYLALLVAGTVVGSWLFPRFEDAGSGVAVPLSITIVWFVTFFVGRVSLTAGIWLGVVVLIAVAGLAVVRGVRIDPRRVGETALVFTVAFLFWVGMRVFAVPLGAGDPVIAPIPLAIGEKMLDFGLLKSLLRAETLPPEDMWFAGEPVAYYYGGHLVAAILARLTGTAGRFAYNLALSGFFAMLVTAVYGVASTIAAGHSIPRRPAAVLSVFAVGIASNLTTPGRVVLRYLPESVASGLANALGIEREGFAEPGSDFYYFDASRVITDRSADFAFQFPDAGPAQTSPTINEFPFFAWLNGDMHAHMMSTAFLVLAAAVCLSYYQTPASERRRRRRLLFGALPPVAGLLAVTSTWSFPTPAGLALLTVALAPADARSLVPFSLGSHVPGTGRERAVSQVIVGLGVAAVVVGLGLLWSLPFWLGPASGREIAIFPDRSSMGELLLVHGSFLAVSGTYLYGRCRQLYGKRMLSFAVLALGAIGVFALADLAVIGLFVTLVGGSWVLARDRATAYRYGVTATDRGPASSDGGRPTATLGQYVAGFETVLVVAAIGLVTLVEFVYMKEGTGRMNTVFKVYMQVWVLWSIAFGPALAWTLWRWAPIPSISGEHLVPIALKGSLALLVLSTGLYAGFAITSSYDASNPTLDGLTYLESEYPAEAAAIHWLDEREGQPVIVTAAPGGYTWDAAEGKGSSAPASLTGLPTVLGWYHEAQYRGQQAYHTRLAHVRTIYTGNPADQAMLLERYDVRYVYVGPAERNRYGDITVDQIPGVRPVQQLDGVTIYEVDAASLASSG